MAQHLRREMRRCAKAEEPDALAPRHACDPKRSESDDPGAEQRRSLERAEFGRQVEREVAPDVRVFCIPAVFVVTGEHDAVAKILASGPAIGARAIHAAYPRDAHALADTRTIGPVDHLADDLVTRHQPRMSR